MKDKNDIHLKLSAFIVVDAEAMGSLLSSVGPVEFPSIGVDWWCGHFWLILTRGRLPREEDEGEDG